MKTVDWSKAKPGFDFHFLNKRNRADGGFYRIGEKNDRFVSETGSYILFREMADLVDLFVINSRPVVHEWNGEDLPPVGTVCEYGSDKNGWMMVRVLTHRHTSGPPCVVAQQGERGSIVIAGPGCFRPVHTPEQIAAEEREEAIFNLMTITCINHGEAGRIYDAGWRKQAKK